MNITELNIEYHTLEKNLNDIANKYQETMNNFSTSWSLWCVEAKNESREILHTQLRLLNDMKLIMLKDQGFENVIPFKYKRSKL